MTEQVLANKNKNSTQLKQTAENFLLQFVDDENHILEAREMPGTVQQLHPFDNNLQLIDSVKASLGEAEMPSVMIAPRDKAMEMLTKLKSAEAQNKINHQDSDKLVKHVVDFLNMIDK